MREVVRAVTLLGFDELVSELGGDLPTLAKEIRLDLAGVDDPQRLLPNRQVHELVNLAAERLRRKDLGLLWGERSDPSRLGPLHVALVNAETGREAIELIARFLHINFPMGSVYLNPIAGGRRYFLGLKSYLPHPPPLIHFYERRIASLHVLLRLVCDDSYAPDEVWFSHSQQSASATYLRVFGVRPSFEMPDNGIVIARRLLDAPRSTANRQVRDMAVTYLKSLDPPSNTSIAAETLRMVSILMRSSNCTVAQTARALSMHTRTLQRRLQAEDASFESIKDEVRRRMAEAMLADASVSLTEVALNLHYANLSALTRSCRRWFRMPPRTKRRNLIKAASAGRRRETKLSRAKRGRVSNLRA